MSAVLNQSLSFFDADNSLRYKSLYQTQYDPSTPGVPNLDSGTSLLVPDYRVEQQLDHFPEELYDLRPESHLVRLMKALLGDSGAGQLRKRYLMARLQSVMSSTHFFDLDAFYGAIFGINRRRHEAIPFNPYRSVATADEWDKVHISDSSFRERILALAKAIPMGGSPRGLQTAAEAITSVPCDIIENWARMDFYLAHGFDPTPQAEVQYPHQYRTWDEIRAIYSTYSQMEAERDWLTVMGTTEQSTSHRLYTEISSEFASYNSIIPRTYTQLGEGTHVLGAGLNPLTGNRTSFVVRPKQHYTNSYSDQELKAEDALSIRQVLNLLKPAGSLLNLNMSGVGMHVRQPVAAYIADSEHWEIVSEVEPYGGSDADLSEVYPRSPSQIKAGYQPYDAHILPRPPFSGSAGEGWSYNTEVVSVSSFVLNEQGYVSSGYDYEIVPHFDGSQSIYGPNLAVMDSQQAESSRLAGDGSLLCSPYSQGRVAVLTHD